MKIKLLVGIIVLVIIYGILQGYQSIRRTQYYQAKKSFSSKEECEKISGKQCNFFMCDYIPKGKSVEEVCGDHPYKGYYPIDN